MAIPKNKDFSDYDNYLTDADPTTAAQAQDYFKNQAELLKAVIDSGYWQPETRYAFGAVVKSDSMPSGTEAVCVAQNGGLSSNIEPSWGEVGGANVSDGTCFWRLRLSRPPVMQGSNDNSVGKDGLVPAPPVSTEELFLSNSGEWKEAGKVKSVNGQTGDVIVDLPIGHMYFSVEPSVPAGKLPAFGATYNRALYADLWAYAQERGLVISESEWQAQASANDGNCSYYSDGDGSTTFRVPSLKCWIKGANSIEEVGSYLEAGSPNITGAVAFKTVVTNANGAFSVGTVSNGGNVTTNDGLIRNFDIDASRSSKVYGNSDTVQPKSIVGMWLIVAFGTTSNTGNSDVANVMQVAERVQTGLSAVENGLTALETEVDALENFSNGINDYIVESYCSGNNSYRVWKSGFTEQWFAVNLSSDLKNGKITLFKAMPSANYFVSFITTSRTDYTGGGWNYVGNSRTTTNFTAVALAGLTLVYVAGY